MALPTTSDMQKETLKFTELTKQNNEILDVLTQLAENNNQLTLSIQALERRIDRLESDKKEKNEKESKEIIEDLKELMKLLENNKVVKEAKGELITKTDAMLRRSVNEMLKETKELTDNVKRQRLTVQIPHDYICKKIDESITRNIPSVKTHVDSSIFDFKKEMIKISRETENSLKNANKELETVLKKERHKINKIDKINNVLDMIQKLAWIITPITMLIAVFISLIYIISLNAPANAVLDMFYKALTITVAIVLVIPTIILIKKAIDVVERRF